MMKNVMLMKWIISEPPTPTSPWVWWANIVSWEIYQWTIDWLNLQQRISDPWSWPFKWCNDWINIWFTKVFSSKIVKVIPPFSSPAYVEYDLPWLGPTDIIYIWWYIYVTTQVWKVIRFNPNTETYIEYTVDMSAAWNNILQNMLYAFWYIRITTWSDWRVVRMALDWTYSFAYTWTWPTSWITSNWSAIMIHSAYDWFLQIIDPFTLTVSNWLGLPWWYYDQKTLAFDWTSIWAASHAVKVIFKIRADWVTTENSFSSDYYWPTNLLISWWTIIATTDSNTLMTITDWILSEIPFVTLHWITLQPS